MKTSSTPSSTVRAATEVLNRVYLSLAEGASSLDAHRALVEGMDALDEISSRSCTSVALARAISALNSAYTAMERSNNTSHARLAISRITRNLIDAE